MGVLARPEEGRRARNGGGGSALHCAQSARVRDEREGQRG
jgi:hypothetical protein